MFRIRKKYSEFTKQIINLKIIQNSKKCSFLKKTQFLGDVQKMFDLPLLLVHKVFALPNSHEYSPALVASNRQFAIRSREFDPMQVHCFFRILMTHCSRYSRIPLGACQWAGPVRHPNASRRCFDVHALYRRCPKLRVTLSAIQMISYQPPPPPSDQLPVPGHRGRVPFAHWDCEIWLLIRVHGHRRRVLVEDEEFAGVPWGPGVLWFMFPIHHKFLNSAMRPYAWSMRPFRTHGSY